MWAQRMNSLIDLLGSLRRLDISPLRHLRVIIALMGRNARLGPPKTRERKAILEGCRPEKAVSDTVDHPWPLDDRVRWVEWRVRELTIEAGQYVDERGKLLLETKAAGGQKLTWGDKVADYAVWLLKERDGLSWHQIAYQFFPWAVEKQIETYESKVRRAYYRVERNHPGSKRFRPKPLSERDRLFLQAAIFGPP
jgi:hypothetical protein